jgi:nitroreductase
MTKEQEALKLALEALEEIALAGMSPSPEMSDIGIDAWHARQAWRFIGIAARALDPIKEALAQPVQERPWVGLTFEERNGIWRKEIGWGDPSHNDEDLMKAIEAKLKDKNNG